MGYSKKTGKGRLDKYYFLAKDQGYRARSAFKLIQLNKKYGVLDQARVTIDLCAAPGGWLQVAAKFMPASHLIVGVDLVQIKPIPGVITIKADITTEKCRGDLKRELKGWKADCVLHDGAPNVGKTWLQDAYSQSELVLHSLKLATEFLVKDGSFVTKVFRSKDYNSLMWVFNQLFSKVEATKPSSSRDVSAEIFVVCRGFKAPDRIDPRLLDPKTVFEDVSLLQRSGGGLGAEDGDSGRINLEHPEKRIRNRSGYADGATILYKTSTIDEFIYTDEQNVMLATCSALTFDMKSTDSKILSLADNPSNKDNIREICKDLKVIGHREFKVLLKWRLKVRESLGILEAPTTKDVKQIVPDMKNNDLNSNHVGEKIVIEDIDIETEQTQIEELNDLSKKLARSEKREKLRAVERKAKQRLRMQNASINLADEMSVNERLFSINRRDDVTSSDDETKSQNSNFSLTPSSSNEDDDLVSLSDSDDGGVERWAEALERDYELNKSRTLRIEDPIELMRKERAKLAEEIDNLSESSGTENDDLIGNNKKTKVEASKFFTDAQDIECIETASKLAASLVSKDQLDQEQQAKIDLWYTNPLFTELQSDEKYITKVNYGNPNTFGQDKDEEFALESSKKKLARLKKLEKKSSVSSTDEIKKKNHISASRSSKRSKDGKEKMTPGTIEFVKSEKCFSSESEHEDSFGLEAKKSLMCASGMTLAAKLAANKKRALKDIVDDSFNRHTFSDRDGLPNWFIEDELKFNRPQKQITKEGIALLKSKQREIDARPIKKVIEAKARNRRRAERKIEAIKQKAALIADSEEIGERQKSEQIQKLLAKGNRPLKKETKLVIAKGSARGLKGRPKGVKGHYKMVDSRLKKDMRAKKRAGKRRSN